ncbi:tRNA pseudouridine(38-40) synthase TruA [uncultured Bacteroides sp.]|uniref:tRNA pseudouridine(38-40) synthase TruA n=1 Tax=uncultured Bacteroides sp. TaxID=162156 RepID=UPI002AAB9CB2|nr:tRNA pseudouridine(38-40) synthase TruA [uncultured Bacteroides sp.]
MTVQRYFIYFAYDGTNYHGWQIQPNGITVQECLEKALSIALRQEMKVIGAGRTDAGVHASLMVAHFDLYTEELLDLDFMTEKLNRLLPPDISVFKLKQVKPDVHARFAARSRTYKYYVTTSKYAFNRQYHWRVYGELDFEKMNEAAQTLFRYADFTSFSKLHTDVKTNICEMMQAEWTQVDTTTWVFTIRADRFLRNMVRAIVGTLIEVGRGKLSIEGFQQVIELQDRSKAGTSAPGNALFLVDVEYSDDIFI